MDRWEAYEAILQTIRKLSASYTPEWEFNPEDPDAGSAIALIFARQMSKNVARLEATMPRLFGHLVHMMGLAALPPEPAKGTAAFSLVPDTIEGMRLPAGTRLLARGNDDKEMAFETEQEIYVTDCRLKDMVAFSETEGKIISYEDWPVRLFDFNRPEISRYGVLIGHHSLFDAARGEIYLKFQGNCAEEIAWLTDPQICTYYIGTGQGFEPAIVVRKADDILALSSAAPVEKITYDGSDCGMIYIKASRPVKKTINLDEILVSAEDASRSPEFFCCREQEVTGEKICPLGDRVELYQEFYMGSNEIFGKNESKITVSFELTFEDREIHYEAEEEYELKPVMRRRKRTAGQPHYTARAECVTIEYFNGTGWRKLLCDGDYSGMWSGRYCGPITLTFFCPADWKETVVGGYEGRVLRFLVTRADNCYLFPCTHKLPVMKKTVVTCSYRGIWLKPDQTWSFCGTERHRGRSAFLPFPYQGKSVLFGFDRKPQGGPVSLYFRVRKGETGEPLPVWFEYSTAYGFKKLRAVDHTLGFTKPGSVLYFVPEDMAEYEAAGRKRVWLRLVWDESGRWRRKDQLPLLDGVLLNAVNVQNVETGEEEPYYIDSPAPDMEFFLGDMPILDAEVYVNEASTLSAAARHSLMEQMPCKMMDGGFFVKWEEAPGFEYASPSKRCYVLDRTNHLLKFGNGVHGMIPGEKSGVAFTVKIRCCDGRAGNIGADSIALADSSFPFIGSVTNPESMRGGGDCEQEDHIAMRGMNLLSHGTRMVSARDYEKEALIFSDSIVQAVCASGEGKLRLVLLMKDSMQGPESFDLVREPLRAWLAGRCGKDCGEHNLAISEPEFITYSVEVWLKVGRPEEAFSVRQQVETAIRIFLEPDFAASGESDAADGRPGRAVNARNRGKNRIGALPDTRQVEMMLGSLRFNGYVEYFHVTAEWSDETGRHQAAPEELKGHPYGVCVNGTHVIHITSNR